MLIDQSNNNKSRNWFFSILLLIFATNFEQSFGMLHAKYRIDKTTKFTDDYITLQENYIHREMLQNNPQKIVDELESLKIQLQNIQHAIRRQNVIAYKASFKNLFQNPKTQQQKYLSQSKELCEKAATLKLAISTKKQDLEETDRKIQALKKSIQRNCHPDKNIDDQAFANNSFVIFMELVDFYENTKIKDELPFLPNMVKLAVFNRLSSELHFIPRYSASIFGLILANRTLSACNISTLENAFLIKNTSKGLNHLNDLQYQMTPDQVNRYNQQKKRFTKFSNKGSV